MIGWILRGVMLMKLMITGSRKMTKGMDEYVDRVVERAIQLGWHIVVGDAPGIDRAVIQASDRHQYAHIEVHGAYLKLRNKSAFGINIEHDTNYDQRDRMMIDLADKVLAIWNGVSEGTKRNYDAAKARGKEAWLKSF
jgi:hypothetical protein